MTDPKTQHIFDIIMDQQFASWVRDKIKAKGPEVTEIIKHKALTLSEEEWKKVVLSFLRARSLEELKWQFIRETMGDEIADRIAAKREADANSATG